VLNSASSPSFVASSGDRVVALRDPFSIDPFYPNICYNPHMILQEQKDKADIISKLVDSLYKKLIILLAIDGAFGTYAIKYTANSDAIGYVFAAIFILTSVAIVITYAKMNLWIKRLEEISDE